MKVSMEDVNKAIDIAGKIFDFAKDASDKVDEIMNVLSDEKKPFHVDGEIFSVSRDYFNKKGTKMVKTVTLTTYKNAEGKICHLRTEQKW